jgi:hypothetical protein
VFGEKPFDQALYEGADFLRSIAKAIEKEIFPGYVSLTFNLNWLSDEESVDQIVRDFRIPDIIGDSDEMDIVYVMKTPRNGAGQKLKIERLQNALVTRKKVTEDNRAYSRVRFENQDTNTLYVGRSKANKFKERMVAHLSATRYKGRSSLHLSAWAGSTDLEIGIYCMTFKQKKHEVVQAIEDSLSRHLRPAFGRDGER